ncbi:menaquinone-dependent protoporphyrinogen IX dehydrogenase [Xanthobacteraceae bacterium Astr-EGSB]|uniref:menaquinone-dependent protoporphyrinogen IX dehydrogenase n=1 Tax=Astrobacterium formosum TaxID=3069710 RepID=UPI0027B59708|nr:menaquinone-dependent protoporphyrinogen IX dehydrogenase [Xanthobacteraceae bacterium Astr-EGSB]
MLLCYATRDGQAKKIATHVATRLAAKGIAVSSRDLATDPPSPAELAAAPLVAAVLAIRYGKHLPQSARLVEALAACNAAPPLVLASVCLTARKPGKDTAEGNVYLRKFIARNGLKPVLATAIAGRLAYPGYRWFDRLAIRFIMWVTGGPTDPSVTVEFTDWAKVDAFADDIATLCAKTTK